ncbi:hypothetical protein BJ508DRAFT_338819 [Ascobolus immersus RN42]|uniref:Uncharacterized protein n=1 Tax=Ascobolus immersus RN42 TaxID=1160509 RepID=A0A3N4HUH8_ASCIM|nr:hypothetical protein BJ508DRAFT_338819 [Ascobolus immersus RN42]
MSASVLEDGQRQDDAQSQLPASNATPSVVTSDGQRQDDAQFQLQSPNPTPPEVKSNDLEKGRIELEKNRTLSTATTDTLDTEAPSTSGTSSGFTTTTAPSFATSTATIALPKPSVNPSMSSIRIGSPTRPPGYPSPSRMATYDTTITSVSMCSQDDKIMREQEHTEEMEEMRKRKYKAIGIGAAVAVLVIVVTVAVCVSMVGKQRRRG